MDRGQRKFAERMADELRRRRVSGAIELDEERFSLIASDGHEYMLDNAYAEWQRTPRLRRGRVLRRYASIAELPEVPESAAEARRHLMPRVRDAEYFATLALQYRDARDGKGPAYSAEPVNDQLFVEVVRGSRSWRSGRCPRATETRVCRSSCGTAAGSVSLSRSTTRRTRASRGSQP